MKKKVLTKKKTTLVVTPKKKSTLIVTPKPKPTLRVKKLPLPPQVPVRRINPRSIA